MYITSEIEISHHYSHFKFFNHIAIVDLEVNIIDHTLL